MAETAKLAVFHGTGRPFEIREYPVPEPEPGAMLVKIALANTSRWAAPCRSTRATSTSAR
jgi:Zn-dependent alcohol dehydrogenase